MPELSDVVEQPLFPTRKEQLDTLLTQPDAPSFTEAFGLAAQSEWLLPPVSSTSLDSTVDPDFKLTPDRFADLARGRNSRMKAQIADATSEKHLSQIIQQQDALLHREQQLAQLGWGGIGMRMAAAVLDPTALAATTLTEGVAAPFVYAQKATRLQRMFRAGLVAAGTNAAIETELVRRDTTRGPGDILATTAMSFGLGSVIGRYGTNPDPTVADAANRLVKEADAKAARDAGLELTDKGKQVLERPHNIEGILSKETIDQMVEEGDVAPAWMQGRIRRQWIEGTIDSDTAVKKTLEKIPDVSKADLFDLHRVAKGDAQQQVRFILEGRVDEALRRRFGGEIDRARMIDEVKANKVAPDWMPKNIRKAWVKGELTENEAADLIAQTVPDISRMNEFQLNAFAKENGIDINLDFGGADLRGQVELGLREKFDGGFDRDAIRSALDEYTVAPPWLTGRARRLWTSNGDAEGAVDAVLERIPDLSTASVQDIRRTAKRFALDIESDSDLGRAVVERSARDAIAPDLEPDNLLAELEAFQAARESRMGLLNELREFTPGKAVFSRMRFDMVGRLSRSKSPLIQRVGAMLGDESVGRVDDAGNTVKSFQSASEFATLERTRRQAQFRRVAESSFADWAAEKGHGWIAKQTSARDTFMEEVGRAMRAPRGTFTDDVHVNRAADTLRDMHREMLEQAKVYGVRGFTDVPVNDNFVMRMHSVGRISELTSEFGEEQVIRLIANSLRRGSEELDPEKATPLAKAYLRHIVGRYWQTDVLKSRMFSEDQTETLVRVIKEELPDITEEQVQSIVFSTKTGVGEGISSRAKRRIDLDETHTELLTNEDGTQRQVGIADLLENNAEVLTNAYTTQVSGAVAESAMLRSVGEETGKPVVSFDGLLARLTDDARAVGMSKPELEKQIRMLTVMRNAMVGVPVSQHTNATRWLSRLRDMNFIRVMNQVGFAQITEIGNTIGQGSISAMSRQMPAFRQLLSRAKNGEMNNELLREIEALTGLGTERLRRVQSHRFDFEFDQTPATQGFDRGLGVGKGLTADLGGLSSINAALQRGSAAVVVQKLADMAFQPKARWSKRRLASLSLDDGDLDTIMEQLRKHSTFERGEAGGKIRRINLENWDDQRAAAKLTVAIDKFSKRTVQQNDIGNLALWMTTDLGRTIFQFRSFVSVAWAKQLLFGLHNMDFVTFNSWSLSMLFAGLAYTAQTSVRSVGRDDQQDYLDERLTAEEIGKAAFQKSGFASLTPGIVDTALGFTGRGAFFGHSGRSTNLETDLLTGNPTVDMLRKAKGVVRGAVAAPTNEEYDFSQDDYRNATGLLPNMIGVDNILKALGSGLPNQSLPNTRE